MSFIDDFWGEQAASVLSQVGKLECAEAEERFKAGMRDKYDVEGSPYHASARLWDDGVILPRDTRSVVALSLSAKSADAIKADVKRPKI